MRCRVGLNGFGSRIARRAGGKRMEISVPFEILGTGFGLVEVADEMVDRGWFGGVRLRVVVLMRRS
jgi:hypothetical protein